jgi:hypothetical protein
VKTNYYLLAIEVDKLYGKQFPKDSPDSIIEEHLKLIESFIVSCGWTTEEYTSHYINESVKDLNPNPNYN